MKDNLAEKLLARVTGWDPKQNARELSRMQALARYKYDEYQQFTPGKKFIESLALWLSQFDPSDDIRVAYELVKMAITLAQKNLPLPAKMWYN